jgi:2,5-diketo-D-gluconate reductase B
MTLVHANGAAIPAIGLGTWRLWGDECAKIVAAGLRAGYRHIDTAQMYENEEAVAAGIAASGVPRGEIFLTTKIWPDSAAPGRLERAAEERLRLLNVDQVDLLLIHWPPNAVPVGDVMASLARVKRSGLTRHIGVSNSTVTLVEEAIAASPEPLVTNQVEYHPFLNQQAVLETCRRQGLSLTAYCPIARGRVFEDLTLGEIATRNGRSPAQIALRWLIQQDGVIAIPKTATPARLGENLGALDFTLGDDDMAAISRLASRGGRMVETAYAPAWD